MGESTSVDMSVLGWGLEHHCLLLFTKCLTHHIICLFRCVLLLIFNGSYLPNVLLIRLSTFSDVSPLWIRCEENQHIKPAAHEAFSASCCLWQCPAPRFIALLLSQIDLSPFPALWFNLVHSLKRAGWILMCFALVLFHLIKMSSAHDKHHDENWWLEVQTLTHSDGPLWHQPGKIPSKTLPDNEHERNGIPGRNSHSRLTTQREIKKERVNF